MALIKFTAGVNNAHRVQRWAKQLWHTHQRDQFFSGSGYYGPSANNVVQLKADFAKQAGYQMTEGLIMPFDGAGVLNDLATPVTGWAAAFHRKEALLRTHFTHT